MPTKVFLNETVDPETVLSPLYDEEKAEIESAVPSLDSTDNNSSMVQGLHKFDFKKQADLYAQADTIRLLRSYIDDQGLSGRDLAYVKRHLVRREELNKENQDILSGKAAAAVSTIRKLVGNVPMFIWYFSAGHLHHMVVAILHDLDDQELEFPIAQWSKCPVLHSFQEARKRARRGYEAVIALTAMLVAVIVCLLVFLPSGSNGIKHTATPAEHALVTTQGQKLHASRPKPVNQTLSITQSFIPMNTPPMVSLIGPAFALVEITMAIMGLIMTLTSLVKAILFRRPSLFFVPLVIFSIGLLTVGGLSDFIQGSFF